MATIIVPTSGTVITSAWGKSVADEANLIGTWAGYVPTLAGDTGASTVGNGSIVGRYTRVGQKACIGSLRFVMGSTTSLNAGVVRLGLPLPGVYGADSAVLGSAYLDAPFGGVVGLVFAMSATTFAIFAPVTAATNVTVGQVQNTHLSAGKGIVARFAYELA